MMIVTKFPIFSIGNVIANWHDLFKKAQKLNRSFKGKHVVNTGSSTFYEWAVIFSIKLALGN